MEEVNERRSADTDSYVRSVAITIRALIAQIRSNPADFPALRALISDLLGTAGLDEVDPGLAADAAHALMEASEKTRAMSSPAPTADTEINLTDAQKKQLLDLYSAIDELKEEMRKLSEILEEIKKKEDELAKLVLAIEQNPFSKNAETDRIARNKLIFDTINLSLELNDSIKNSDQRLTECKVKRDRIDKDETLTEDQRKALLSQADRDIEVVAEELKIIKGQSIEYARKVASDLERALLEEVAAKVCSTEQEYTEKMRNGLLDPDKKEIAAFIEKIKATPIEKREADYADFVERFVDKRVAAVDLTLVIKDRTVKANEGMSGTGAPQVPEDKATVIKQETGQNPPIVEVANPTPVQTPVRKSRASQENMTADDINILTQNAETKVAPPKTHAERIAASRGEQKLSTNDRPKNHVEALRQQNSHDPSRSR